MPGLDHLSIEQMETCLKLIIQDDTPVAVILHVGCNGISNKDMPANDILKSIISNWEIL